MIDKHSTANNTYVTFYACYLHWVVAVRSSTGDDAHWDKQCPRKL